MKRLEIIAANNRSHHSQSRNLPGQKKTSYAAANVTVTDDVTFGSHAYSVIPYFLRCPLGDVSLTSPYILLRQALYETVPILDTNFGAQFPFKAICMRRHSSYDETGLFVLCLCMCAFTCTCTCVCVYVCVCACMRVCSCMRAWVWVCIQCVLIDQACS